MSLAIKRDCCKPDGRKVAFKANVHINDAAKKIINSKGYEKIKEGIALFSDFAAKHYAQDADIFISTSKNLPNKAFAIFVKNPKGPQRKEALGLDKLRPPKLICKDLTKQIDNFFNHIK